MKLQDLRVVHVQRAVNIYMDLAYGGAPGSRRMPNLELPAESGVDRVLTLFQRETIDAGGARRVRYTLRLGTRNYPFMKLVLQEHLVEGEFTFVVDTHDEMEIKPDFPDYEAWMAVRRFNRKLKVDIESQLASEGLPTPAALREIVDRRAPVASSETAARTILVVDDEDDLADCVGSLLRARGFRVERVADGRSAVLAAQTLLPNLIVLDYELPEMDGLEVIAALRAAPATRSIPVLLTTASRIGAEDVQKAEGFLAKPYGEELLYAAVQRLLPHSDSHR